MFLEPLCVRDAIRIDWLAEEDTDLFADHLSGPVEHSFADTVLEDRLVLGQISLDPPLDALPGHRLEPFKP